MKDRSAAAHLPKILLALGCLMAMMGAHAQTNAQTKMSTGMASIQPQQEVVPPATTPATTPAAPTAQPERERAMQTTVADREAARAQRIERREMISEGLGISVADLNSLLQMVRPDAEEPRQPNQPLRQELAGNP